MKKNIMIYLLMALVCFGLQSCLFQEEDYFDDSSANRATEEVKQYRSASYNGISRIRRR